MPTNETEAATRRPPEGMRGMFLNVPNELLDGLDEMLVDHKRDPRHRTHTRTDMVREILFEALHDWQRKRAKAATE